MIAWKEELQGPPQEICVKLRKFAFKQMIAQKEEPQGPPQEIWVKLRKFAFKQMILWKEEPQGPPQEIFVKFRKFTFKQIIGQKEGPQGPPQEICVKLRKLAFKQKIVWKEQLQGPPQDIWVKLTKRIYINTEVTATSYVFNKSVFCLRKPEAIEKTTPKLLSAVFGEGVQRILYFISILCTLYSRLGQIIAAIFEHFCSVLPLAAQDQSRLYLLIKMFRFLQRSWIILKTIETRLMIIC